MSSAISLPEIGVACEGLFRRLAEPMGVEGFICCSFDKPLEEFMRGILLWLIGLPIPVIILLYVFDII